MYIYTHTHIYTRHCIPADTPIAASRHFWYNWHDGRGFRKQPGRTLKYTYCSCHTCMYLGIFVYTCTSLWKYVYLCQQPVFKVKWIFPHLYVCRIFIYIHTHYVYMCIQMCFLQTTCSQWEAFTVMYICVYICIYIWGGYDW